MEYNRSDIRNIAFETINDRFSKGKYLGIEVTIDMGNGYIHGSHLVGQVMTKGGQPKQFTEWRRSKEAIEIIEYLTMEISMVDIIKDVTDAPNGLRGAYIHPRLVAHVAQWASPIFADKVAIIINSKAIEDAILEKNIEIIAIKKENSELSNKIDIQTTLINEQSSQIKELLSYAKETKTELESIQIQLDNVTDELDSAADVNDKLTNDIHNIAVKLDISTDQRVPPASPHKCNDVFAVFHYPNTNKYRMVRCQKRSYKVSSSRCINNGYTTQIYYSDTPNSVNLGQRLKTIMPASLGLVNGVLITLSTNKTSVDLLSYIQDAEQEKKRV